MSTLSASMTPLKPIRIWPGVAIVALQWFCWGLFPILMPEAGLYGIVAGVFGGGLGTLIWWLFFSRAAWVERIGAVALMAAGLFITSRLVHESIAGGGMGLLMYFYAIPVLCLALVVWAAVCRRLAMTPRRVALAAIILAACGGFTLLRTGGITGEGVSDFHWRWTPTPEERLLAVNEGGPRPGVAEIPAMPVTWSGFRGPERNGIVPGSRIGIDWSASPPAKLWQRPIGPGWSSFAVQGDVFFTQEQRGDEELVACYHLQTGQPVWAHRDRARFWESNAGAGPRATPTLHQGRVYTLGATGILNALSAADGKAVWTRNAAADTGAKTPDWGFAGSPLVVDDLVVAATSGRLAAYELATGAPRWTAQSGGGSYSSPQLVTVGGTRQIVLLNTTGAIAVNPADGKELWKHAWAGDGIVQPAVSAEGDLLLGSGSGLSSGLGVRRIRIAMETGGWTTSERWTSKGLKPYYNDFIIHQGHAYGFDGGILACIDLADGQRKWKGGRFGHGQLLLLAGQDLLLVLSEKGELALVEARPGGFKQVAKTAAIEGKTWNHPVLAGDILLVRNDQEMAAMRLGR